MRGSAEQFKIVFPLQISRFCCNCRTIDGICQNLFIFDFCGNASFLTELTRLLLPTWPRWPGLRTSEASRRLPYCRHPRAFTLTDRDHRRVSTIAMWTRGPFVCVACVDRRRMCCVTEARGTVRGNLGTWEQGAWELRRRRILTSRCGVWSLKAPWSVFGPSDWFFCFFIVVLLQLHVWFRNFERQ